MKNLPIVLVVEDDKAIVHLLSTILDANDYRVVQVSTGREALSTISSHCPDVVLLDLGLPDMDGVDIIKNVRQWSQVPIIVLSARNRERDKVEALDLGADDYVTKPFGTAELLAHIRIALRHVTARRIRPPARRKTAASPSTMTSAAYTWTIRRYISPR
jgi:two-component system KDP operon response regulator KdpE